MRLFGTVLALLGAAACVVADPVIDPWNKITREYVVANKLGSSVSACAVVCGAAG